MTTTVLILVLLVGLALAWFSWWGKKPFVHKAIPRAELPRYFQVLFDRGLPGGFFLLRIPGKEAFVQARKEKANQKAPIVFDFPRAEWSEPFYDGATDLVSEAGYQHKRVATQDEGVSEFLQIFANTADEAAAVATLFFDEVFEYSEDELAAFEGLFEGVTA